MECSLHQVTSVPCLDAQNGDKQQSSFPIPPSSQFLSIQLKTPVNFSLVFADAAAPLGAGRVLSPVAGWDRGAGAVAVEVLSKSHKTSKPFVDFPNPSGHYCQKIKNYYSASQITSGCCLWDCVWHDHICGRGLALAVGTDLGSAARAQGLVASPCPALRL